MNNPLEINRPMDLASAPRVPKLLLSPDEAASAISVSRPHFDKLVKLHAIPVVRLSRQCPRYDPRDLIALAERLKENPLDEGGAE